MLPKICSFSECGRVQVAKGLCRSHYGQLKRGIPLRPIRVRIEGDCSVSECSASAFCKGMCKRHYRKNLPPCSIEDCQKPRTSHGYCSMHVKRLRLHGDVEFTSVIVGDDLSRFFSKVHKTPTCWEWAGSTGQTGYGRFAQDGKTRKPIVFLMRFTRAQYRTVTTLITSAITRCASILSTFGLPLRSRMLRTTVCCERPTDLVSEVFTGRSSIASGAQSLLTTKRSITSDYSMIFKKQKKL